MSSRHWAQGDRRMGVNMKRTLGCLCLVLAVTNAALYPGPSGPGAPQSINPGWQPPSATGMSSPSGLPAPGISANTLDTIRRLVQNFKQLNTPGPKQSPNTYIQALQELQQRFKATFGTSLANNNNKNNNNNNNNNNIPSGGPPPKYPQTPSIWAPKSAPPASPWGPPQQPQSPAQQPPPQIPPQIPPRQGPPPPFNQGSPFKQGPSSNQRFPSFNQGPPPPFNQGPPPPFSQGPPPQHGGPPPQDVFIPLPPGKRPSPPAGSGPPHPGQGGPPVPIIPYLPPGVRGECNGAFVPGQLCCDGIVNYMPRGVGNLKFACCHKGIFNFETQMCCNDVPVPKPTGVQGPRLCCGPTVYDPRTHICCDKFPVPNQNGALKCCRKNPYNPVTQMCCGESVKPRPPGQKNMDCCGKHMFNPMTHMCCEEGNTFMKTPGQACCGKNTFSPAFQKCCFGDPMPKGAFCFAK